MRIAVLAWGSLVWNRGCLAIASVFEPNGPHLSVEFSRVSENGCLTLVIDPANGARCQTYSAVSAFSDLHEAVENLRLREGLPNVNGIGFADRIIGQRCTKAIERHPRAIETIEAWADANGFDAAIWTALAGGFEDRTGEPFSVEAAIRYLEALDAPTLDKALNYIRRAPDEVRTPVRAAVTARWPEA